MNPETNPDSNLSPVKRALLELRRMRTELEAAEARWHEPIAVVGAALRFPGNANSLDSFWDLLRNGVDATSEMPRRDWDIDALYDPDMDKPGKFYNLRGGYLDNIDQFDPALFGITPREAMSMDPQQRILLEVCWEAIENARMAPDALAGSRTGLFIGVSYSDYMRMLLEKNGGNDPYCVTGGCLSLTASRLAFHLDLRGPCMCIDTACSSSLVAIHSAVDSLKLGESDLALAGGVSMILTPEYHVNFCQARMLAHDGRCKTYDASADGYSRGEGCAVVALKRLADAQRDGDPVLAVVRGGALNHDGRPASMTAPSGPAQEALVRDAMANARISPDDLDYLELHGTGTPLGDPIESNALGNAVGRHRTQAPLQVGSVKTNFGHLEACAGIAGFLKTVLVLKHNQVPPHLHLNTVSPHIDLDALNLTIPSPIFPGAAVAVFRIAGGSCFCLSGTNAHLILERAPEVEAPADNLPTERPCLFVASGRSEPALKNLAERYRDHLSANPDSSWLNLAYTTAVGRAHLNHRLSVVASSTAEAEQKLSDFLGQEEEAIDGVFQGHTGDVDRLPRVAFLFPGQGCQYAGMGRQLYDALPVFRDAMDQCAAILESDLPRPLLDVIFEAEQEHQDLNETLFSQAAIVATEYALAQQWIAWGVQPAAVVGHSLGEYTAACIAGVMSLEDALALVTERGRLANALPANGAMAVVFASESEVSQIIDDRDANAAIAAINGPLNVVVSGEKNAVDAIVAHFATKGVETRRLAISRSFHSPLVEPILDDFRAKAASITLHPPNISLLSNVTGKFVTANETGDPDYWARHLRLPVRFAEAIQTLQAEQYTIGIDVSPRPVLVGMAAQVVPDGSMRWLHSIRSSTNDHTEMLENLGRFHVWGGRIDWAGLYQEIPASRVELPTYAFDQKRYWFDQLEFDPQPAKVQAPGSTPPLEAGLVWDQTSQAAQRQALSVPINLPTSSYGHRWETLEQISLRYIEQTLRQLNEDLPGNACRTVDATMEECGV